MEENRTLNDQTLYDDYIEDAFTYSDGEVELSVDSIVTGCISSSNDSFSLDENGNLVVNSISFNGNQQSSFCDIIYPIGSIYMSINNVNPSILFGGTWEQIRDKFLLGAGNTYIAGTTGGEANHTLSIAEMPSHEHHVAWTGWQTGVANQGNKGTGSTTWDTVKLIPITSVSQSNLKAASTGLGQAHNNMPPYLAVNIWKRTA